MIVAYVKMCNVVKCAFGSHAAAMVDEDPEEHWFDASGNVLPPSRWISQDAEEEEDTYGSCIGLRCRPWQRC
jgi:hypothetical protein